MINPVHGGSKMLIIGEKVQRINKPGLFLKGKIMGYAIYVNIWQRVWCRWCGGGISKKIVGKRKKRRRWDTDDDNPVITEYHEECWAEAIEIEI